MRSSTSFSSRAILLLLLLCFLSGCLPRHEGAVGGGAPPGLRVAVLPVENLTGGSAPLAQLRGSLLEQLGKAGLEPVGERELSAFMARRRLRYTGGVDAPTAAALREELGADLVFITSLELYDRAGPRISLTCRAVATGAHPVVRWIESVAVAGDEAPGLLGLGLVSDPVLLQQKAVQRSVDSFRRRLNARPPPPGGAGERRFRPNHLYRTSILDPAKRPVVALVPFVNKSRRSHAGTIVMLHFASEIARRGDMVLLEPGVVRDQLLRMRFMTREGISYSDLDIIAQRLEAEYTVSGKVFDYQDIGPGAATPKVDLSALVLGKAKNALAGAAKTYHTGDEGVFFFNLGKVDTAGDLSSRMVGRLLSDLFYSGAAGGAATGEKAAERPPPAAAAAPESAAAGK